jgi:hypothetical protein
MMIGSMLRIDCGSLERAEAEREAALALALRERRDARADRLADDGAVVDAERDHDGPEGARVRDDEHEQDHEQHGHAAEELEHDRGRDAHGLRLRGSRQREDEADGEREQAPEHEGAQRRAEPGEQAAGPGPRARLQEDVPAVGVEGPAEPQLVDAEGEQRGEDDGEDHREQSRDPPGLRARGVVEHGAAHRCTLHFFSRWSASWPSGTVMMRYEKAMPMKIWSAWLP